MPDETSSDSSGLPPKINVRKAVPAPAPESSPEPQEDAPAAPKPAAPKPAAAKPVAGKPAAPKPAAGKPVARPKTIKARPIAKPVAKPASSPVETSESDAAAAEETPAPAKPATVAKKPLAAAAKPRTVKAKPVVKSAAAPAEAPAEKADAPAKDGNADPSVRVAAKRETAKIPLDAARPKEEGAKIVKPMAKPKTVAAPKPKESDLSPEEATKQATAAASKRTTSRISLEAVLGAEDDDSSSGPKTIRLKRPGATASGKVNTVTTVRKKPVPKTAAKKAGDAEAGDEPKEGSEVSATQRKTVVVKKSGGTRTARKKVSVSRAGGEGAAAAAAAPAGAAPVKKQGLGEPGWVFAVYSLAAVLVTCVLIYVITAQVVGPNASLTEYSYSKTGPELPWPGKLAGPRPY